MSLRLSSRPVPSGLSPLRSVLLRSAPLHLAMSGKKPTYIYDLPYGERESLCRILDLNEGWKTLGGRMKFSTFDIQCMERLDRRGQSPSDELLTKWGSLNHTVQELFVLLSRMNHSQAMTILKPFVDSKFHKLMSDGEASLTKLLNNVSQQQPAKSIAGPSMSSSHATTPAAVNRSFVGHNLNVMLPETQKLSKPAVSDSVTIQNGVLPPAGVAAMGGSPNIPVVQHNVPNSAPQRKLSVLSMATFPSEYMLPMKDYKELEAATNGWNPANIIGKGGFGTVFKGLWKNTVVAIKRIEFPKGESPVSQEIPYQQSQRELQVLQRIHHQNILQLYSVSFNGNQPCLVYQFMEKGSLEDRLQCRNRSSPLTWQQRYNIVKGAARGLQYLHTVEEKPLIHGDIKSANILLDANFEPRIGDFGLAREGPHNHYTHMQVSRVHGTRPYLPFEFLKFKKLSTKVDTYSFGVVLFEIATGLRAFDDKRGNKYLKDEVTHRQDPLQLMDPKIEKAPTIFIKLVDLGRECVSQLPKDRPEMKVVCQILDQHIVTSTPVTPRELQEYYDAGLHRPSIRNIPQPGLAQTTVPSVRPGASHQASNGGVSPSLRLPNFEPLLPTELPGAGSPPAASPAPSVSEISESSSESSVSDSSTSSQEYVTEPTEEAEVGAVCLPALSVLGL